MIASPLPGLARKVEAEYAIGVDWTVPHNR